jgi:hypothetical protein
VEPQKPIPLSRTEQVIAVVPEYATGSGWGNQVLWVHIADHAAGTLRTECIQSEDQTPEQLTLFRIGAVVCAELAKSVKTERSLS